MTQSLGTLLGIAVSKISYIVEYLRKRGIEFEKGHLTLDSITFNAWKTTRGHINLYLVLYLEDKKASAWLFLQDAETEDWGRHFEFLPDTEDWICLPLDDIPPIPDNDRLIELTEKVNSLWLQYRPDFDQTLSGIADLFLGLESD